jgi:hypothetical protein
LCSSSSSSLSWILWCSADLIIGICVWWDRTRLSFFITRWINSAINCPEDLKANKTIKLHRWWVKREIRKIANCPITAYSLTVCYLQMITEMLLSGSFRCCEFVKKS